MLKTHQMQEGKVIGLCKRILVGNQYENVRLFALGTVATYEKATKRWSAEFTVESRVLSVKYKEETLSKAIHNAFVLGVDILPT